VPRQIYGRLGNAQFVLADPLRNIETYDLAHGDLSSIPPPSLPNAPIGVPSPSFGNAAPAAVSAHYHATVVFDFYNDILKRNGIDDKGMKLISVVNVYNGAGALPPPRWANAVWAAGKMWYGQDFTAASPANPVSFARCLDVIGHELTHGVTETTSALVYRDLPGALNESFSDVFGIIIANWSPGAPNPVNSWNWQIGAGIGRGGGPIRDFANPAATGQPVHMSQYVKLPQSQDYGGVHIYSGIHNKAVHGLLTAPGNNGDPEIPAQEVALLMYLTLTRLTPTSDFSAARRTLENVAGVYYGHDPALKARRLAAIAAAYSAVGIV
jgi:Zn-dependent metalloprotease